MLCRARLAGPVFALIEQPQYGWGSARVAIPLIAGLVLLAAFVVLERREREPMLPFELFASRNFTVGNLTTLTLYAGLGVATFFLVLFLQQVARYTALESGLALLPITIIVFAPREAVRRARGPDRAAPVHGRRADHRRRRAAAARAHRRERRLHQHRAPGYRRIRLGLAATVAPLTAAVLGAVAPEHSGVASGVNNMVSRVAGLLAIAALGAVITGSFQTRLQQDVNRQNLGAPAPRSCRGRASSRS